ncbi:MAG TPA: hypothetical protein VG818_11390 [Gemmatimonadaceae bacterium]|nr:hypothetical protein [Gemmatimonadaceae bacterium]
MLVVDLRLTSSAQLLNAIRTVAARPRVSRFEQAGKSPGTSRILLDRSLLQSGNATGDINAALLFTPGLTVTPTSSGALDISAFGLGAEQTTNTLDGLAFEGSLLPRDGVDVTALLSSYDPRSEIGGVQVNRTIASGGDLTARSIHATGSLPTFGWNSETPYQLSSSPRQFVASGSASGPVIPGRSYYATALQASVSVHPVPSLETANASQFQALGVNADSVQRVLEAASLLGIPLTTGLRPLTASQARVSNLTRIDFTPTRDRSLLDADDDVFYVVIGGGTESNQRQAMRPLATASRAIASSRSEGEFLAHYSTYRVLGALSDTKLTVSGRQDRTRPYETLPTATVSMPPAIPSGTGAVSSLTLGGLAVRSVETNRTAELTHELSWKTFDQRHRFGVFMDARASQSRQYGSADVVAFDFPSPAAFAQGQPDAYTRTVQRSAYDGRLYHAALGLGDVFHSSAYPGPRTRQTRSSRSPPAVCRLKS